ncbi:MAG: TIGR04149 family rSAM-modified RiPP [Candidatus Azobacteroides sp.]|nr:TIGR04149 family rSAM-modified RiPP [Candidatus Azobacteroides sp.]
MKKLGKLKLNQFSKAELDQRALNALKGGCTCACVCPCPGSISESSSINSSGHSNTGGY